MGSELYSLAVVHTNLLSGPKYHNAMLSHESSLYEALIPMQPPLGMRLLIKLKSYFRPSRMHHALIRTMAIRIEIGQ